MSWLRELKMAALSLKRAPGFVITSVGTLALTLAVLLLVVSIGSALLIKPLNYPDEERLMIAEQEIIMEDYNSTTFQTIRGHVQWYKTQTSFDSMALVLPDDAIFLSLPGEPRLPVSHVTPEYFELFDVPLLEGRAFNQDENLDNKALVILISEKLWRTKFNASDNILDQSVEMDDKVYQIIGVVADNFVEPHMFNGIDSDVWFPFDATWYYENEWGNTFARLRAIGKVAPGTGRSQIITDLENSIETTRPEWAEQWPELQDINPQLRTFREVEVGDKAELSMMLLAGALSLLLIAIVNVTNLFFSRAVAKQQMLAIQAVLGARRQRLFFALLAESAVICVSAALLGLFLAAWGLKGFVILADGEMPLLHALSLDMVVFSTALLLSLLLSLLFAYTTSRLIDYRQLRHYIQSGGKGGATQVSGRTVKGLITAQVTLASVLLIFSAMILSKALERKTLDIGANITDTYNVNAFTTNRDLSLEEKSLIAKEIRQTLLKHKNIERVGLGGAPIHPRSNANSISTVDGKFIDFIKSTWISEGYLEVFDITLLSGRYFSEAAYRNEVQEMVISESAAKKLVPEGNALGKTFIGLEDKPYEIVGIVEDVNDPKYYEQNLGVRIWWPMQYWSFPLQIKMAPGQTLSRDFMSTELNNINDKIAIWEFFPLQKTYNDALYQETLTIYLTMALAFFTLVLASAGIYGVLNYNASLRRFEFGIRMALGAKRKQLYRLMSRESLLPVIIGMVISGLIVGAILLSLRTQLLAWMAVDPGFISLAIGLTFAIALLACLMPVRALLRGNPITALRNE